MGMHYEVGDPYAEQTQDAVYDWRYVGYPLDDYGTRRGAPAELPYREYDPVLRGWYQGERRLHNFRPKLYYTRPSDGKRKGAAGRLKDAFTGEGPDVFVTMSGDRRTLMRDRPQRWQWSGWGSPYDEKNREARWHDKDWREQDDMPLLNHNDSSRDGQSYNFKCRKYHTPRPWWYNYPDNNNIWTDARWSEGARHADMNPLSKQHVSGRWTTRVPRWSGVGPFRAGGRPRWK
ncbi:hypothetical protein LTR10_006043 [Elasticomyces elasticus]|nr:hypothetical protein LTR10_006043 [Elasticomyces elasticus]KAK4966900.1 hypothetical protein LTR42_011214 [Elasticomyces elasticus]